MIALIAGGGSALLPAPPEGLTLEDEIAVNRALLASGAPISDDERRPQASSRGSRAAGSHAPLRRRGSCRWSSPTSPATCPRSSPPGRRCRTTARPRWPARSSATWRLDLPPAVLAHLESPAAAAPDPGDPVFAQNEVRVIASAAVSLEAAAAAARAAGVEAAILSDAIEGEARDVGRVHAAIAREVAARGRPFARPVVLLSGGETTVTVRGKGKGGRNGEFLLAFALAIDGVAGIHALAADTDGIDGSEDNAGGFADGGTAARVRAAGRDPRALLAANDAWTALEAAGDLFVTGPTGTNVNDFRAILIA